MLTVDKQFAERKKGSPAFLAKRQDRDSLGGKSTSRDVLQNGGNVHVWPAWRLLTRDSPSLRDTSGKRSCSS
jgi:hypothetical protein